MPSKRSKAIRPSAHNNLKLAPLGCRLISKGGITSARGAEAPLVSMAWSFVYRERFAFSSASLLVKAFGSLSPNWL